jgi:hypothetical protein
MTMNFSSLSAADKRVLIAAVGVIIGGVIGVIDRWGSGGIIGLLAGIAAAVVVLLPQLSPGAKLPMAKGITLLGLGIVATAGFALAALQYLDYALAFTRIYSILFDLGLVAAVVLLWFGWTAYKAERGATA